MCCSLAACTASNVRTLEYLDQVSAATVSAVAEPLVFARARPELAAHARDYVRLAAVDVNRAGRHDQWVLAYLQSTVDPRLVYVPGTRAPETLFVRADDRVLRLVRVASSAQEVGITRRVHAPKGVAGEPVVYRVEASALAFIAGANNLTLRVDSPDGPAYELWSDGRASLAEFLQDPSR